MNSLEISLALLAGIAIIIVGAYNVWIARQRMRAMRSARSTQESAGTDRGEPSLGLEAGDGAESTESAGAGRSHPRLNPIADCIVELAFSAPVPGERLLLLTRNLRRAGSKPVIFEGLSLNGTAAHGDETDEHESVAEPQETWGPLIGTDHYSQLRVGVLLANRNGALNAMEFSEFVSGVQGLADQLSVLADTPDMTGVLARARELDEVCANLDVQIGIAVDAPESLSLADLGRLAASCDCVERGNNRYARLGAGGEVVFSMSLSDTPNRLGLLVDVPRAPRAAHPWVEMVECAKICAQQLGGTLVDEAGRPLPDTQLERIEAQLEQRYESLEAAGFPAGSAMALRLFN